MVLKVGIVGTGVMGLNHARIVNESERAELANKRVELENRRISAELRKKEIELEREEQNLMADAMRGLQAKDLALSDISEGDDERGNKSVASNGIAKSSKGMIKKCMEDLFDNTLVINDVGTALDWV